jgi:hypothetical protein
LRLRGNNVRMMHETRTDDGGRFLVIVGADRRDNRADEICFELTRKGEPTLRVEAPGRMLRPGIDELGDLVLGDGELLAAGKIVAGGKPYLAPISLRIERWDSGELGRGGRWRRVEGALEHKDDQGGFTIRGAAVPGRYRVTPVSQATLPGSPVEFPFGAKDLVLDVHAGFAVAASVLLPPNAQAQFLRACWVPANATDLGGRDLSVAPSHSNGERHDLQWNALPAGEYSLHVTVFGAVAPSAVIPAVHIPLPAGGDPRLQEIDLRTATHVVMLDLIGPDGPLVDGIDGIAFPVAQADPAVWHGQPLHSPQPRLLLPTGNYELLVCVQGFRPVPVRGGTGRASVRLDRWPTVRVVVAGVPPLPEKARLSVGLVPLQEPQHPMYRTPWSSGSQSEYLVPQQSNRFVQNGVAEVAIGDGAHGLRLTLRANRRNQEIVGVEPAQVLSSAGEIVVRAPAAAWKAALDAVGPPAK